MGRLTTSVDAPRESAQEIHHRAGRSIRLVLRREVLSLLVTFSGGVVIARKLAPADLGLFAIASFIVMLVSMVAELGLPAALIQRAEVPNEGDLRTAFTIQQITVTAAAGLLWSAAGWLPSLYAQASPELVGLVRLMTIDLYLGAWCHTGEALLERTLRYERLAPIGVAVSIVYNGVAVALVLGGHGVRSLGYAMVAASFLKTVLIYHAAPWAIRPAFDSDTARALLRASIPIQIGRVVTQAQYWVTPTLVAGSIGPAAAGLLQWAAGNGRKPLDLLENVARVSLPHFSLLQHDEHEVERMLSRYVLVFVLVCGLWLAVLSVAGRDLVAFVYTTRWVPAVMPMVLFAVVGLLVAIRVLVTSALVGLGRMDFTARVGVAAALATILASVGLVLAIGFIGVPIGQLVGATVVLPLLFSGLRSGAMTRVLMPTATVLLPMGVALAAGVLAQVAPLLPGIRGLLTAGVMTLAYGATAWWAAPDWLRESARHRALPTPERVGRLQA